MAWNDRDRAKSHRRPRQAVLCTAIAALVFTGGFVLAPILENAAVGAGGLLRLAYSPICHQKPERSLAVGAGTQAVCARCSGLYAGGVAGLALSSFLVSVNRLRPRRSWLLLAATPTLVDLLAGFAGLPGLPNLPRWFAALPLGLLAALFLAVGIADFFSPKKHAGSRERGALDPADLEETHG